ncbi:VTC domain protein [Candidatus Izimaplasma bacterium HR1]|jgi:hypothetical protein|uniref:polyphosphate polymerase domain-containing protein n=1 Tax=Candidatus Izimoplasma sp. HR1 TaxID=1541959 RepID=UPI0004F6A73E|nr:VTC domain protein [Candidatus Izimaplasma bacterium HR1]
MKEVHRQEHKYLISYVDYFKVREAIKTLLIHDQHGPNESYQVNSIYLDDIYFSGAQDKAFGNELHKKYRIRYYDDITMKKLELKKKTGNSSIKISTPINEEVFKAIVDNDIDILEKHFDDKLIRLYTLDFFRNNLEPKCNIIYKREAYRDESDNFRITFDHSLEVSRFDKEISGENIKLMKDTMLMMEIKYEHFIPKEIKTIIKSIAANQIAYSKYFLGYDQIIL